MNILDSYTQDESIAYLLKTFGIQPNLKGWKYLNCAVKLAIEDDNALDQVTKILYPYIAKRYNTTSARVERGIRHAIEAAFDISAEGSWLYEVFSSTYSPMKGKPTNSAFIAMCVELLTTEVHHPIFNLKEARV